MPADDVRPRRSPRGLAAVNRMVGARSLANNADPVNAAQLTAEADAVAAAIFADCDRDDLIDICNAAVDLLGEWSWKLATRLGMSDRLYAEAVTDPGDV